MSRFFLILSLSFSFHGQSLSQDRTHFYHLSTRDGLSFGAVSTLSQDTLGFIWVGTKNGLNRYDGSKFKVYHDRNSRLQGNGISKILIDEASRMWVGTYSGLYLYHPPQDTFQLIELQDSRSGAGALQVNDLIQYRTGQFWLAAEDGLYALSADSNQVLLKKMDLGALGKVSVKSLALDLDGDQLFVGTKDRGLWIFQMRSKTLVQTQSASDETGPAPLNIRTMLKTGNSLLLGTWNQGIYQFSLTEQNVRQLPVLNKHTINCMGMMDSTLWVGLGNGLAELDLLTLDLVNLYTGDKFEYSLSSGGIDCMLQDRDGNKWFGSTEEGLNVIGGLSNGLNVHFFTRGDEAQIDCLNITCKQGRCYIGSSEGIYSLQEGLTLPEPEQQLKKFNKAIPLGENQWVFGSFKDGFALSTGEGYRFYSNHPNANSLSHNHVRDAVLKDSVLYLGTWGGGLDQLDLRTNHFVNYRFEEGNGHSLSDDDIVDLVNESDTILWLATYGGGLNRFNVKSKAFTRFQHKPGDSRSISSNDVICLYKDSRDLLWIGYWGGGLDFMDLRNSRITRLAAAHTLPGYIVTSIQEDGMGRIWFSTKNGIGMYDPDKDQVFKYGVAGFYDHSFEIGSSTSDTDGKLYFGGRFGCISVDPYAIDQSVRGHAIIFTQLSVLGERSSPEEGLLKVDLPYIVLPNEPIPLKYYHRLITFEFANPVFPTSKNYSYEVRLSGFDQDWRAVGNANSVTYTNLRPGDYTFRVRGYLGDDRDYVLSRELNIHIARPWWTTHWALIIYVILFTLLLYLFYFYSTLLANTRNELETEQFIRAKENELNELKQRFFTNLSHEFRTPLTLITNAIENLSEKMLFEKTYQRSFQNIKKHVAHLSQLTDEIIDFRRIDHSQQELDWCNVDLVDFCQEIFLSFSDAANKKGLKYEFTTVNDKIPLVFDPIQMEKVLYNLFSNAVKFTPDNGRVSVWLETDEQFAYIKVQDTGIGIPAKDYDLIFQPFGQGSHGYQKSSGFGLGLFITKDIVSRHSGEILVESTPDKGTTFMVKLPRRLDVPVRDRFDEHDEALRLENARFEAVNQKENLLRDLSDKTILIIEDHDELRQYLVKVFAEFFTVWEAPNGQRGWEICLNKMPDIVISDVLMPEMDGITFTRNLKSDKRTSHIPVIILTARTSLIFKHEGYETGADDYITKPFNKHLLISRVRNLLHNRALVANRIRQDMLTTPAHLPINSKDEEFLKELIDLIDANVTEEELSAAFFVRALGMSHSVIYKKLKSLTGMSLVEFVRDYRLKLGAKMIRELGLSVTETAHKTGFTDPKYFSRMFKKKFGVNPSKYGRQG